MAKAKRYVVSYGPSLTLKEAKAELSNWDTFEDDIYIAEVTHTVKIITAEPKIEIIEL